MMKKISLLAGLVFCLSIAACNNEPKLEKGEEVAVENQLSDDQKSMDSLEAAIMSQMDALNSDSAGTDTID
jgi:hypothetical protein